MLAVTDQEYGSEDADTAIFTDSAGYADAIDDVSPQPAPVWWEAHLRAA